MSTKHIAELLSRYEKGACTDAEKQLVDQWFEEHGASDLRFDSMEAGEKKEWLDALFMDITSKNEYSSKPEERTVKLWPRIAGVAAAVVVIAFGGWFLSTPPHPNTPRHPELVSGSQDIAPGKNTATLTVNGKTLQLSDTKAGIVVADDIKYNDGTAVISSAARDLSHAVEMTLVTPRGGTYYAVLSDGTKIWLNADSKLEVFPNFWNKKQRIVKLTGEAYFEVVKDKLHPFVVQSAGQSVTVLGTHFNVNAYTNEGGIKTTLLEGSVRVTSSSSPAPSSRGKRSDEGSLENGVTLKPNQQSTITGNTITIQQVDPTIAIAWKNKEFMFEDMPLQNVMRMIERWYNVEVIYNGPVTDELFGGSVSRFENVSKVLKSLEATGKVHFKIEGRRIYVSK